MGWDLHNTNLWSNRFGLASASRGSVIGVIGGSQVGGSSSAPLPLHKPAGITYIKNNSVQSDYAVSEGLVPGLANELDLVGKTATIITRIVDATIISDWISTNFATFVSDCSANGVVPNVIIYPIGGNDNLTAGSVAKIANSLTLLEGLIHKNYPGCGFLVSGLISTDLATFPFQPQGRIAGEAFCQDRTQFRQYLNPKDLDLQVDNTHPTSAGYSEYGSRAGLSILRAGVIR